MSASTTPHDLSNVATGSQRTLSWYFDNARRDPRRAVGVLIALLRGHWYKRYYRLRGVRFRAGSNFRVLASFRVRGPGEVIFGDNVEIGGHATPFTYDVNARIVVGDNVMIGATRFGCVREIVIGRDCILADASIRDSDFHSVHVNRRSVSAPIKTAPVHIADNVWVCAGATILAGTRIGKNSVVGCGAVCMREYPENVIIMGNPAKPVAPVPAAAVVDAALDEQTKARSHVR
jgi:acetyltransferase-like isoleucine patch superfamily enzyme